MLRRRRIAVGLVLAFAGCASEKAPVAEAADAGGKPAAVAKPVAPKPLPVRERGIASIGGKVVDALGGLVQAEVVLARRDEKAAIARERTACEPEGLDDALDVLRERVTHARLETQQPDSRGRFVFKALAPGSYVVWAETATHRSASYPVDVAYLHAELGLVATVPKRSVELKVTTTLGQPGRGLEAIVYDGSGRVAKGTTNADGKVSFPALPLTGLGLVVQGPGVSPTRFDVPDGLSEVAMQAVSSGPRTVRVTDDGKPAGGVTVTVRGPRVSNCTALTEASGEAKFGAIPLDGAFAEVSTPTRAGAVDLGADATSTLVLGPPSQLLVSVVDEAKQPVAGARVAVFGAGGPARVVKAGADGLASLHALKGDAEGVISGAAGADGYSAETFAVPWKQGIVATTVRLRTARPVECKVNVAPEAVMPEGRLVLRGVVKKGAGEVLPLSLDGRTAWRDEVPSGEWTCGFEDPVDGKVLASRPFKHPLTEDGSFVALDVR